VTGGSGGTSGGGASGGGVLVVTGNITLSPSAGVFQNLGDVIAGGGGLVVNGPGTVTLNGGNTYTGPTLVQQGVLQLGGNGALGGGLVMVSPGAMLNLKATAQNVSAFDTSGTLADALGGTGPGQYGKLDVSGNATIAGELDISVTDGFQLAVGDQFNLIGFGTLTGDFATFAFEDQSCTWTPSGSGGTADCFDGTSFMLSELAGTDPDPFYQLDVLTVGSASSVPEPATLALLGSGLGMFFLLGRRRRNGI
jgi:autotransporter-associated beta strand protein